MVKNPPANGGDIRDTGSVPEGMTMQSSILTCGIPWTQEAGRLYYIWLQRVRQD